MAALALSIGLAERILALRAAILARRGRAAASRIRTFLIRHLILQNHFISTRRRGLVWGGRTQQQKWPGNRAGLIADLHFGRTSLLPAIRMATVAVRAFRMARR